LAKKEAIEVEGLVNEALPNAFFKIGLPNGHEVLAHASGKIRKKEEKKEKMRSGKRK